MTEPRCHHVQEVVINTMQLNCQLLNVDRLLLVCPLGKRWM